MSETTEERLRAALATVTDPASGRDLVSAGRIDSIQVKDGLVQVALRVRREEAAAMEPVRREAEALLARVPGIRNATIILTAHRDQPAPAPATPHGHAGHGHQDPRQQPKLLQNVGAVIAIASGKGGVGKSTVATNLAVALAGRGLAVGLLDADIYGPSLPHMLGVTRRPEVRDDKMLPIKVWGLEAISIGFITDPDTAMIWRGPMVMGALQQLMEQVAWGKLDVMVIDLPPGTGDAQLTLAQRVTLAGAVIVSTPQDVALADARRGVKMFETVGVKILGLVENMSFFCCPECGHRTEIFGHGGARAEAARLGVPFLGEIPLLAGVRESSDSGTPIVISAPENPAAAAFQALAASVQKAIGR
jgi:ATP-binding protein involved in chromosome partitioning